MSRPLRILVVEDEELLATVIADVLGDSHDVGYVPNAGEAIDHLLGDGIDFVLLNCILPDGPNWQVALEADRLDIPVVRSASSPHSRQARWRKDTAVIFGPWGWSAS